jgi:hypothetical protein
MMADMALFSGTTQVAYIAREPDYATNTVSVFNIEPSGESRECMLASEAALMSVWMTPAEDDAWKDV